MRAGEHRPRCNKPVSITRLPPPCCQNLRSYATMGPQGRRGLCQIGGEPVGPNQPGLTNLR